MAEDNVGRSNLAPGGRSFATLTFYGQISCMRRLIHSAKWQGTDA